MIILPSISAGIISSSKKTISINAPATNPLGPPLPSAILLQGGWTSAYGRNIDGQYIYTNGDWFGNSPFYYNPNVIVEDGYCNLNFECYPVLAFGTLNFVINKWMIFADDISYINNSTNSQSIPSTNWYSETSLPIGTIQAVN